MRRQKYVILPIAITLALAIASCGLLLRNMRDHHPTQLPHASIPPQATTPAQGQQDTPKQSLRPAEPVALAIPRLRINAPVTKSGLLADGEMEAPAMADIVSWYKYGYLPGSVGNAVFAGHNIFDNSPGAFQYLYSLQTGDEITVTNDEKSELKFTVTQVHQYDAAAAPVIDIFGPAKKAQIRLITCAGEWDNMKKMFGDRVIVTAEFSSESTR